MKTRILLEKAAIVVMGAAPCMSYASGVPVVDVAAIAHMVEQLQMMNEQYKALQSQLEEMREQVATSKRQLSVENNQLTAMTGDAGMSDLHVEDYAEVIPTNWRETLALSGEGKASEFAEEIEANNSHLDESYFDGVDEEVVESLRERMSRASKTQGANAATYDASAERFSRLDELRKQIAKAKDLKGIADLQARIQIENATIMNELVQLQAMNAMQASQDEVRNQSARQEGFRVTEATY